MKNLGFYPIIFSFFLFILALCFSFVVSKTEPNKISESLQDVLKDSSDTNGLNVLLRVLSNIALMAFFIDRISLYPNIFGKGFIKLYLTVLTPIQIFYGVAFLLALIAIAVDIVKYFTYRNFSNCRVILYLVILVVVLMIMILPSLMYD